MMAQGEGLRNDDPRPISTRLQEYLNLSLYSDIAWFPKHPLRMKAVLRVS